jgi:hypothetical protein
MFITCSVVSFSIFFVVLLIASYVISDITYSNSVFAISLKNSAVEFNLISYQMFIGSPPLANAIYTNSAAVNSLKSFWLEYSANLCDISLLILDNDIIRDSNVSLSY